MNTVSRIACLGAGAVCLLALVSASTSAFAQAYPSNPIRLMVPFEPGTLGVDYVARTIASKMGEFLGQPVIIENRAGANGMIGSGIVSRAAPDGYTLLFTTPSSHITSVFLLKKLPFDPVKDFTPITAAVEMATVMVVHSSVPTSTVKEFVEYVKRNPGKLSYGSAGIGSTYHFVGEQLKQVAKIDMFHVPYKSSPSALAALVSGQIHVSFTTVASAVPQARAGKLKILAVLGPQRFPGLPDIPTVSETVPAYERPAAWFAFFGPRGLPPPILTRVHGDIVKALHAPDVSAKLTDSYISVIGNTPEQFAALMQRGYEVYGEAAKAAGIQPQ